MTEQEIVVRICKMSEALGFMISPNVEKIARLKAKMSDFRRCPCDPKNELRYCGSRLCEEDTLRDGHCHCNCMLKEGK